MNRRNALSAMLALAALGMPIVSRADKVIIVERAPPAPREEVVVTRKGYVWQPGYWRWDGHRHVWVKGHSVRARHGYHWAPHRWEEHEGRWRFDVGHWDRD